MIHVTFPDGAQRAYEPGVSGLDIAKSISPSLAKRTVAMVLNGELVDLADPIDRDAKIEFVTREDPRALELIRHDAAHVLAEAVQSLWPGTQVTIGPVIENGFYYDFFRNQPFTPEDFPAIEKKMREIIARDKPFTKRGLVARRGEKPVRREGRGVQGRACRYHSRRSGREALQPGRLVRPVPRPAHDLDRQDRRGFQADEGRRRLLARRFEQADAVAHLRDRVREKRGARRLSEAARGGREARSPPARPRDGPVSFPGRGAGLGLLASEGLDAVPDAGRLHAPASRGDYQEVNAPQVLDKHLWEISGPLGLVSREHVHVPPGRRRGRDRGFARFRAEAHELPRPCADLQARPALLSRAAAAFRGIRRGQSLRAVGRAAWPDARALLHAGRRAYLLHRGADGRGMPQDQ